MRPSAKQAKQAHRRVALFLGLFLIIHFATHFAALGGIAAQDAVMQSGRAIYRSPLIEIALVLTLAVQVYLGIDLLRRITARKRKGTWHWVQFASGCYLAYFIGMHTSAALITRLGFGLDTNFYWAAGTLTIDPISFGFAPYYTLVVVALVAHLIAALHFRGPRRWHAHALIVGPVAGIAIVLAYSGALFEVTLPQEYREYYAVFPGVEAE